MHRKRCHDKAILKTCHYIGNSGQIAGGGGHFGTPHRTSLLIDITGDRKIYSSCDSCLCI